MKNFIKGIGRFVLFLLGVILLLAMGVGTWVLFQPSISDTAHELQDEALSSAVYRQTADSALAMIQKASVELELPSVSVAVSVENEIVWAASLGMADISEKRASKLNTRYRAGSVSKSMTGLAAAKLVEMGKLDLDAPIYEYVPSFPPKKWEPSLRELASHTGGIRHYSRQGHPSFWGEVFSKHHYTSVEEALVLFKEDTLLFEPGTGFQYSTHGFTLLSAALETASGTPYLDLVSKWVWKPANMHDTRPDDLTQEDENRIIPYINLKGKYLHVEGADPSYKWAGGGILTTPSDLVKMGGAFLSDQLFNKTLRDTLFIPRPLADASPNPQDYALGFRNGRESELLQTNDSLLVLHHGGASPGGSSFFLLIPDGRVAGAIMTNVSLSDSWPLRKALHEIAGMFRNQKLKTDN